MDYTYLVQALRNYREVHQGQFDQTYSVEVKVTQDAANAIEALVAKNAEFLAEITALKGQIEEAEFRRFEEAEYSQ